jgi:hypothetical protein
VRSHFGVRMLEEVVPVLVWNPDALLEGDSNVDETGNSGPVGKRVKGE